MTIENKFYVLIRNDAVFLGKNDELVDDIRSAIRCANKNTAMLLIQEYEYNHGYKKSGFKPILVMEKLAW